MKFATSCSCQTLAVSLAERKKITIKNEIMEKVVTDFSLSLFLWQTFLVLFSIFIIYVLYKFGKILYNLLKKNS
jgi:hypothetical protein